jgi:FkbM family methyltransferase
MKKNLRIVLQRLGLYNSLINYKRSLDQRKAEKQEHLNAKNRLSFYSGILKKGDLVFDVGANIGNRTEIFHHLGAKVIAVEPQPDCIKILEEKFPREIYIEPVGLAGKEGEMEMFIANESTISTFSSDFIDKTKEKFKRNNWEKKLKVRITTLDKLIQKHGKPEFCKIDVEGFEPEVLKGLSAPINKISFEYNVPQLVDNIYLIIEILERLSTSYRYNYCIGESMKLTLTEWKNPAEFRELIKSDDFLNTDFGDIYAFIPERQG